jgi:sugar phosphate isomerase/epimerase
VTALDRRQFGAALLAGALPKAAPSLTLGFSTYGTPKLKTEAALAVLGRIGFDSVELCVLPERDTAPLRLSAAQRQALRRQLRERGLKLTALMEQLIPSAEARAHAASRARLARAAELAHDLAPAAPPLLETVLGGGAWDKVRGLYRDRLGDWGEELRRAKAVLAIKPHRFGAMSLPEHAGWLIRQLKSPPWLRLVYDFSHYDLRGQTLEQTVRVAAPWTAFVAVKDAAPRGGKIVFQLPGASDRVNYVQMFRLLHEAGYRGDVNCEVSGMIWARPDYDAVTAARTCYAKMSAALATAGLRARRG